MPGNEQQVLWLSWTGTCGGGSTSCAQGPCTGRPLGKAQPLKSVHVPLRKPSKD